MPQFYIEEDETLGDISIYDDSGAEIVRFQGERALEYALQWAKSSGFELRSNLAQEDLVEIYRLFFRRGMRRLRLFRMRPLPPKDPPNVQRIIITDFEDFFEEEAPENPFESPDEA